MNNEINDQNNNYNNIPDQMMPDINDLIVEQKPFVDDDYILQLHHRLGETRELRKIAENSIKILNSRINCLENENQKTLSKINLTSKKTNNKLLNIEQKKNHSKEKSEHLKKLENDLKILKEKNQNLKIERDNGLINSRKNVISENQKKGKISKKEKEDIFNIKKMFELNEHNKKKNKVVDMKKEIIPNNKIKQMVEISKKNKLIKDLEEKINYEINRKEEIEENINKMIQEEKDTMERIKKIDEMQKKIFLDFQKSLNQGNGYYTKLNLNFNNNKTTDTFVPSNDNFNDINDNNIIFEEHKDFAI